MSSHDDEDDDDDADDNDDDDDDNDDNATLDVLNEAFCRDAEAFSEAFQVYQILGTNSLGQRRKNQGSKVAMLPGKFL